MYAAYTDDQALLANSSHQESLQEPLVFKWTQIKLILRVFKPDGTIYIQCKPLKSQDHFTYFGSNISSTVNDANICLGNAWTPINNLSIIGKSDLSDWIKRIFSKL